MAKHEAALSTTVTYCSAWLTDGFQSLEVGMSMASPDYWRAWKEHGFVVDVD